MLGPQTSVKYWFKSEKYKYKFIYIKYYINIPIIYYSFAANEIEYQTSFDTQYGLDQSASPSSYYDPASSWSSSDTDTVGVTEKQDELDMAVFETIRIISKLIFFHLMYGNKEPRVSKINKLLFSFSLQTILPIAVFGGLGLGALAYWDSITRYTNLCKKVSYLLLKLDISLTYL